MYESFVFPAFRDDDAFRVLGAQPQQLRCLRNLLNMLGLEGAACALVTLSKEHSIMPMTAKRKAKKPTSKAAAKPKAAKKTKKK